MLEWISRGAEFWKLVGRHVKNDKKMTITSKTDKYMKTLETTCGIENNTPEEVKKTFNNLELDSIFVDPNDDNSKK